ncbi:hypothetical protein [Chitinophaga pinensis]|uniref:Uncharacterized protein n=1 Tax=Chitinophaga pinensis TaxID=79329 RepID=A0A5C6LML2_9BACT|nr:hypothetical protein [Chitinophaga pinensis]TWV93952.1 hypothetical protein FEF09_26320 [Chitinophaga pinensis]
MFGINTGYIDASENTLVEDGAEIQLKVKDGNHRLFNLIELFIDDGYYKFNVTEITDYIKIVVSTQPDIDLRNFDQPPLSIDELDEEERRSPFSNKSKRRLGGVLISSFG